MKCIFRYLQEIQNLRLLYKQSTLMDLIGYSDADCGGDCDDFKTTSGYCFQIGGTSCSKLMKAIKGFINNISKMGLQFIFSSKMTLKQNST